MSGPEVLPLGNPRDFSDDPRVQKLRLTANGYESEEAQKPSVQHASLSGPAPSFVHPHDRQGMMGTSVSQGAPPQASRQAPPVMQHPPPTRQPTPDELLQQANAMLTQQHDQHAAQLAMGPSTGNRDDAGGKIPDWLTQEMSKDEQL